MNKENHEEFRKEELKKWKEELEREEEKEEEQLKVLKLEAQKKRIRWSFIDDVITYVSGSNTSEQLKINYKGPLHEEMKEAEELYVEKKKEFNLNSAQRQRIIELIERKIK